MPRYAAIDIGSNSVRMLAAETYPGAPAKALAADREVTRLGESVFETGAISTQALDFLCSVLKRMAESYQRAEVVGVRAVATSAVRDARNQEEFLRRTAEVLQTPVEIISGQEEARLIHLGVQAVWPHPQQTVLIVDVGGGSAEVMMSDSGKLVEAFSRPLGAVRLKEVFLKQDPPTEEDLRHMEEFIELKLTQALRRIGRRKFHRAIVTSASAAAIVSAVNRVPRARREEADRLRATLPQVNRLYKHLSGLPLAGRRRVTGIGPRRAEIIVPGLAVFRRAMLDFSLPSIYYCSAGVRDGIIADLAARGVGKELSRLEREHRQGVETLAQRFGVHLRHARKVASFAHEFFDALQPLHRLPPYYGKLLEAASYLRDIGHYISDTGHHKHSWYVVANSDLPGFTDQERMLVALLCRYHRKSLPQARHPEYQALKAEDKRAVIMLTPLLRLADSLDRNRDQRVNSVQCQLRNGSVQIQLRSDQDVGLEQWAAERNAETFRQVYEYPLQVTRARAATERG